MTAKKSKQIDSRPGEMAAPVQSQNSEHRHNARSIHHGSNAVARRDSVQTALVRERLLSLKIKYPNDPVRQINHFSTWAELDALKGRRRPVGIGTRDKYRQTLLLTIKTLRSLNVNLQNIEKLSARNIQMCISAWEAAGLAKSTLINRYSQLRRFAVILRTEHKLPALSEILNDPSNASRAQSAQRPLDWESAKVSLEEVLAEVSVDCPFTSIHLRFCRAFGLRVRESIHLVPAKADGGKFLLVTSGTKGGRARLVPIDTDAQRALLEEAKLLANPQSGIVNGPGRDLKAALNHFYYMMAKHRITKAGRGVTAHGLRHAYAQERYQIKTGQLAPVKGGEKVPSDVNKLARAELTQELGHGRASATAPYLGTTANMDKVSRRNVYALLSKLHIPLVIDAERSIKQSLAQKQLRFEAYVVGPAAEGLHQASNVPLLISLKFHSLDLGSVVSADVVARESMDVAEHLIPKIEVAVGRSVIVVSDNQSKTLSAMLAIG